MVFCALWAFTEGGGEPLNRVLDLAIPLKRKEYGRTRKKERK